jgi:FkbM family methyltransferase
MDLSPFLIILIKSANVALNDFDNIILNNIALSDREETLFFDDEEVKGHSGLISMNKQKIQNSKEVKAITFDSYVKDNNIKKMDFIKIDIEGFELNLLKGAEQSIKKFQPKLFMEIDDSNLKKQNTSASELISWLESLEIYQISDVYGKPVKSSGNFIGEHFDVVCRTV